MAGVWRGGASSRREKTRARVLVDTAHRVIGESAARSIFEPDLEDLERIKHLLALSAADLVSMSEAAEMSITLTNELGEQVNLVAKPTNSVAELLTAYALRVGTDPRSLQSTRCVEARQRNDFHEERKRPQRRVELFQWEPDLA